MRENAVFEFLSHAGSSCPNDLTALRFISWPQQRWCSSRISFSVDSIGFCNGVMLVLAYDFYPPVTDLLGEVVTGWAIVGTFLVLLSLV